MAKKATSKAGTTARTGAKKSATSRSRAVAQRARTSGSSSARSEEGMGDAFIKLLQSPLVADLLAVAATAALAALAEHGFSSRGARDGTGGKRAGRAVKEAGKAAAAAIGRRLGTEIDEIRSASKKSKPGAGA